MLKSILCYFICLMFLSSGTCCSGDDLEECKGDVNANQNKGFKKDELKTTSPPSNPKKDPVTESANGNNNDQDEVKDEDNRKPLSTNVSYQNLEQENEKENIDKEVENGMNDIRKIDTEKRRIDDKIKNLNEAIKKSKHRWVFSKVKGISCRPVLYELLRSFLRKAGLKPIEIEQIQSTEDIERYLELAEKELQKIEKKLQDKQKDVNRLIVKYCD